MICLEIRCSVLDILLNMRLLCSPQIDQTKLDGANFAISLLLQLIENLAIKSLISDVRLLVKGFGVGQFNIFLHWNQLHSMFFFFFFLLISASFFTIKIQTALGITLNFTMVYFYCFLSLSKRVANYIMFFPRFHHVCILPLKFKLALKFAPNFTIVYLLIFIFIKRCNNFLNLPSFSWKEIQ